MTKEFNDTGLCIPSKHYIVDTSKKLEQTIELIERGKYFIINRPRQYGKTTTLYLLEEILKKKEDYLPISISFEGVDDAPFESREKFAPFFLRYLSKVFHIRKSGLSPIFEAFIDKVSNFEELSEAITEILIKLDKKVVLLIDEVDKSSNNQLFLHFLGMLRDKYLTASQNKDISFHSVILAGLHDVKTLKLKLRPDEKAVYNSPWNIAIDYKVDMSFNSHEIETMLKSFVDETKVKMDTKEIAEKLFFYTSGYPYLVSKLCKIIDEEIVPKEWTEKEIIESIKILMLTRSNSNFDTLIKNLENNEKLYELTKNIMLGNLQVTFNTTVPLIGFGEMHGIFEATENNKVKIHNKIYEELIINYMVGKFETEQIFSNTIQGIYLKPNGNLDIKTILLKFSEVIEEKYSNEDLLKSSEFLENNLRMLFLVFLKPIINGVGFSFKEVQTSAEKRLDIIVIYNDEKFIIELKLWYGEKYHKQGIEQIKDYMKREHLKNGYMIVMSKNKSKKFTSSDEDGLFTLWI